MSDEPVNHGHAADEPAPVHESEAVSAGESATVSSGESAAESVKVSVEVSSAGAALDLDTAERDLADVEIALARLDSGDYWRDEVTGAELPDELLAARPTARRLAD